MAKKILEVLGKFLLLFLLSSSLAAMLTIPVMLYHALKSSGVMMSDISENNFVLIILQNLAFLIAILIMYIAFERKRNWSLGIKQPQALILWSKGLGLGILLMTLIFLVIWSLGGIKIIGLNMSTEAWKSFTVMCIVFFSVAVGEEVLSRGYLFGLLNYHFSRTTAIIVSSLLFALLHSLNPGVWSNPIPMIELILAGILLAVLRVISGGLWLPIGFHLTWNLFQGNVYGFKVSGLNVSSFIQNVPEGSVWVSGGQFGAEGSVIGFIVTLCAIGIFYYYGLRSRQST